MMKVFVLQKIIFKMKCKKEKKRKKKKMGQHDPIYHSTNPSTS